MAQVKFATVAQAFFEENKNRKPVEGLPFIYAIYLREQGRVRLECTHEEGDVLREYAADVTSIHFEVTSDGTLACASDTFWFVEEVPVRTRELLHR